MAEPQDEVADAPRGRPVARFPGLSAAIGDGAWLALSVQSRQTSAAIGTRGLPLAQARDDELAAEGEPAARVVLPAEHDSAAPESQSGAAGRPKLRRAGNPGPQASRAALRVVALALDRASLKIADLEGLCVANGPGAFTALRVAISVVQGIGIARRLPVIAVPSLAALAVAAVAGSAAGRSLVLTAIDARMGQCYFGAWQVSVPGATATEPTPLALALRPIAVIAGALGDGAAAVAAFEAAVAAPGSTVAAVVLAGSGLRDRPGAAALAPRRDGGLAAANSSRPRVQGDRRPARRARRPLAAGRCDRRLGPDAGLRIAAAVPARQGGARRRRTAVARPRPRCVIIVALKTADDAREDRRR